MNNRIFANYIRKIPCLSTRWVWPNLTQPNLAKSGQSY